MDWAIADATVDAYTTDRLLFHPEQPAGPAALAKPLDELGFNVIGNGLAPTRVKSQDETLTSSRLKANNLY